MLTGRFTAEKEAVVQIEVLSLSGQITPVEAAIDTGFNGFLTLPAGLIRDLDLSFAGTAQAMLGDGSEVGMDIYLAVVLWEGVHREVIVLAAEGGVLMGLAMLAGSRLTLDVEDDGVVTIESLTSIRSLH